MRHDLCKWKILGRVQGCQNIHHQVFQTHRVNQEILLPNSVRGQTWGAEQSSLYGHGFLNKCLVQVRQNMEKRASKIFKLSPGSGYLAMPNGVSMGGEWDTSCIARKQRSIFKLEIRVSSCCGPKFCIIGWEQIFPVSFTQLYTLQEHRPTHDQMEHLGSKFCV